MCLSPHLHALKITRGADSAAQLQPHTKKKLMKPRQWQQAHLGPPAGWASACTHHRLVRAARTDSNHKRLQIQSQAAPTGQTPTSENQDRAAWGAGESPCRVYVPQAGSEIQTLSKLLTSTEITGVVTTTRSWFCTLLPFSTFKDLGGLER